MYSDLENTYGKGTVALSDVCTKEEFQQDWQNMASQDVREVNINHHGNNQTIILNSSNKNPQYLTSTGDGLTNVLQNKAMNIQDLGLPIGTISNARLNLHTCKSNSKTQHTLIGSKLTLM
jgi:hypothetical protein